MSRIFNWVLLELQIHICILYSKVGQIQKPNMQLLSDLLIIETAKLVVGDQTFLPCIYLNNDVLYTHVRTHSSCVVVSELRHSYNVNSNSRTRYEPVGNILKQYSILIKNRLVPMYAIANKGLLIKSTVAFKLYAQTTWWYNCVVSNWSYNIQTEKFISSAKMAKNGCTDAKTRVSINELQVNQCLYKSGYMIKFPLIDMKTRRSFGYIECKKMGRVVSLHVRYFSAHYVSVRNRLNKILNNSVGNVHNSR